MRKARLCFVRAKTGTATSTRRNVFLIMKSADAM